MKWYMIKFKDGTTELFQAHAVDHNNGPVITYFNAVFSDYNVEYYHVSPSEVISTADNVTGEIIDEAKELIHV